MRGPGPCSQAYSTLLSSEATPENIAKRFNEMDTDMLLSVRTSDHCGPEALETMLDAVREPHGWLSEDYPDESVKVNGTWMGVTEAKYDGSPNRFPSSLGWTGKAAVACEWFRNVSKIMSDYKDYTCCLAGRKVPPFFSFSFFPVEPHDNDDDVT